MLQVIKPVTDIEKLKYPIGRFEYGKEYSNNEIKKAIQDIQSLPTKLRELTFSLTNVQLEQSYRPGAWTAKQIVNHFPDVYINAFIRTKWLLTEDNPTIKTYDENACALLADSRFPDLNVSLDIFSSLVERWVFLLANTPANDFKKTLYHPEYNNTISLSELVAMYAWHGYHHLEHLRIIRDQPTLDEPEITLREIRQEDNASLAEVIRRSMEEHKINKPNSAYFDQSLDSLFELFSGTPRSCYFVAEIDGEILGGAGIFPTDQLPENYCELIKMYLKKSARGKGIGKELFMRCSQKAKELSYQKIYIESRDELTQAINFYEKLGFIYLESPLGNSGHTHTNIWMLKKID